MRYCATIRVCDEAGLVYRSFLPEKSQAKAERSDYSIKRSGKAVVFEISAADATALLAASNSIIKMLAVIEKAKSI